MSENVTIPRMRTAANIVAEIKALDPAAFSGYAYDQKAVQNG